MSNIKPRGPYSQNHKENDKFINNRNSWKAKPPIHQDTQLLNVLGCDKHQIKNLDTLSQILQAKICKVEKRYNGDYFKFDFKQPNICDRIKFLQNQKDEDDTSKTEHFKELYKVGSRIGQGAYATVRVAIDLATGNKVAIKIYEKVKIKDIQRRKGVKREIEILEKLNHKNIVRVFDTVESNNHVNIILEYVGGSSLHSFLKKQVERRLDEDIAKTIFKQCVQAIQYCHNKNIAHRDIKLENILLDGLTPKLIDFGFSTSFQIEKKVKMFCGTPSYMAPEIVCRTEYRGDKADIWALGVVLFTLLQGYFPFKATTDQELYARIQSGEITLQHTISKEALDLIHQMLSVDPEQRPNAVEILGSNWFRICRQRTMHVEEEPVQTKTTSQTRKHKLPDDLLEDFNAITKNMSYITPTNQGKQFTFDFSYFKNKQSKQADNSRQAVIPKQQFYTTTNAQSKVREPQFFKVDTLISKPSQERAITMSKERQTSKERQQSFSFESSKGFSIKKQHQLTVHPSFIPSEKSFSSIRSPQVLTDKRSFNFFYN